MTRRLLIDDIRNYKDVFSPTSRDYVTHEDDEDVIARSALEGKRKLAGEVWDELYLDHDLGPLSDTGYDVMCWLEKNPEYLPKRVYFVTANPVGHDRMKAVLERLQRKWER